MKQQRREWPRPRRRRRGPTSMQQQMRGDPVRIDPWRARRQRRSRQRRSRSTIPSYRSRRPAPVLHQNQRRRLRPHPAAEGRNRRLQLVGVRAVQRPVECLQRDLFRNVDRVRVGADERPQIHAVEGGMVNQTGLLERLDQRVCNSRRRMDRVDRHIARLTDAAHVAPEARSSIVDSIIRHDQSGGSHGRDGRPSRRRSEPARGVRPPIRSRWASLVGWAVEPSQIGADHENCRLHTRDGPRAVRLNSTMSGHPDLNRGPPLPQSGALTGLRHVPMTGVLTNSVGRVSSTRSLKTHADPASVVTIGNECGRLYHSHQPNPPPRAFTVPGPRWCDFWPF